MFRCDVREQFSSPCILHDEHDAFGRVEHLEQLDDVDVLERGEDERLAVHALHVLHIRNAGFVHDLDGNLNRDNE